MKTRHYYLRVALSVQVFLVLGSAYALTGSGTEQSPYLIRSFGDFQEFADNFSYREPGVYTKLESDLDFAPHLPGREVYPYSIMCAGYTWNPAYGGVFEGNGHVISNVTINGSEDNVGIFGKSTPESRINNLRLEGFSVAGDDFVGGLVGFNEGIISNCSVSGDVTSTGLYSGCLVGRNYYATISNCTASGIVTGVWYVGGVTGANYNGTVTECQATSSVTGRGTVGGLVGDNGGTISDCWAMGSVTGALDNVGGLVGDDSGQTSDCYATGSVTGRGFVGGLVGYGDRYGPMDCYATGDVTGSGGMIGGLVGSQNSGSISNCYATGNVTGGSAVGGLTGFTHSRIRYSYATGSVSGSDGLVGGLAATCRGTISSCYATGSVDGYDWVGGLVGHNDWGEISDCYATGSVEGGGGDCGGGLVARNDSGTIENCYACGSVSGFGGDFGGLVGYGVETGVTASFWDVLTSGIDSSAGGTGLSTEQMQQRATFTSAAVGWDFVGEQMNGAEDIWRLSRDGYDYPILSWEPLVGDFEGDGDIDMVDFAVFSSAWLATPADANSWNPACDLYDPNELGDPDYVFDPNDVIIDFRDLRVFTQSWPEGG